MSNDEDEGFPLIEMRGDDDEERDYECFNQERYEQNGEGGEEEWEQDDQMDNDESIEQQLEGEQHLGKLLGYHLFIISRVGSGRVWRRGR